MRTPLTVTRAGAVKELAAAWRGEKRSVNQIRIRAVLSDASGTDWMADPSAGTLRRPGHVGSLNSNEIAVREPY